VEAAFFNCNAAFECRRYLFKERGARYVLIMLDEKQKKVGVIAASAGKSFRSIALVYIE
jgi:threonine dehydratase